VNEFLSKGEGTVSVKLVEVRRGSVVESIHRGHIEERPGELLLSG
jgi:L-asparaginase II